MPFPRRIRWEDERSGIQSHGCHFGDGDIDRAALPALIFVECYAGLLKARFLDEFVGALHKGLDILCGADGFLCNAYQYVLDRYGSDLDRDELRTLRAELADFPGFTCLDKGDYMVGAYKYK